MGSHAAVSESPFDSRVRKSQAVIAGGSFNNLLTAFTFLSYGVAVAPIELTAILAHEGTFRPFLYACTNHGYHILSFHQKFKTLIYLSNRITCQEKYAGHSGNGG